jgi:hypothetical protein
VCGRLGGRGVKRLKELVGGGLALALAAPHHAASVVVADEREVAVALAPRDLIQRDPEQAIQTVDGQQLVPVPVSIEKCRSMAIEFCRSSRRSVKS